MNKNKILTIILSILITNSWASDIDENFKFISPYYSNIDKQVNIESLNAQNMMKKALSASDFTVPGDWKLVSTIPENNGFRMFFQAKAGDIYSFVIDKQGHLSPNTMINIKAK